jgi:uncharacterized membrane protein
MRGTVRVGSILFALYPILIFAGLHWLDPRTLSVLVIVALLFRRPMQMMHVLRNLPVLSWISLAPPVILSLAVIALNSESMLLLYPAAVNAGMLLMFASTLIRPPSLIERIARVQSPDLPPQAIQYTRNVTVIWSVFFCINGSIATYTALWSSREMWVLYNGLIAYLLIGALLGGEHLLRHRFIKPSARV